MYLNVLDGLETVNPDEWNRLAGDNPFLRHEFLLALERTGCVGAETGWEPCHVALHAEASGRGRLLGAVPLYRKHHSYGEYVFDWAWADAYRRSGRSYYPKLVAAVPFTPVASPRLLTGFEDRARVAQSLIEGAREVAARNHVSSLHWLFHAPADAEPLRGAHFLSRVGCQFHWSNAGYRDFEDFLSTFTSRKRNNIRRERRRVREAGVVLDILPGPAITADVWDVFFRFYRGTIRAHRAMPYLTREFFHTIGRTLSPHVLLVSARRGRDYVAAALCLRNAHTLYGRYWGGQPGISGLHFETCYYTPIEYCIAQGIARYEAGAQGEHKLARGFTPVPTYSAHWLRDAAFHRAVADVLRHEQDQLGYYMDELNEHTPFRRSAVPVRSP